MVRVLVEVPFVVELLGHLVLEVHVEPTERPAPAAVTEIVDTGSPAAEPASNRVNLVSHGAPPGRSRTGTAGKLRRRRRAAGAGRGSPRNDDTGFRFRRRESSAESQRSAAPPSRRGA